MNMKILQRKDTGYKFYGGSSWLSITGGCLEYILVYLEENPDYTNLFRNSICSDELFFQTILLNSIYKEKIVNDNKRYIKWNHGNSSPKTLTIDDYNEILLSKKLWARKLDMIEDEKILFEIETKTKIL